MALVRDLKMLVDQTIVDDVYDPLVPTTAEILADKWLCHVMHRGFARLEAMSACPKSEYAAAHGYSVGNDITVADIALIPQVINALRHKVDMSAYPSNMRVYQRCVNIWYPILSEYCRSFDMITVEPVESMTCSPSSPVDLICLL
jgi:hypothetical protein